MDIEMLDDVLFAFRLENKLPTPDVVEEWIARHPRFAREIQEAAAMWAEMEMQALLNRPSEDDEKLVMDASSAALSALHKATNMPRQCEVRGQEARTLMDAVREAGTTVAELGRQMSLPATVVTQVVRGKIMGATIPEALTRMLARLLGKEVDWVRDRYPGGVVAAYTAVPVGTSPPGVPTSNVTDLTFQEVVMEANGMDEAQRRFWLEEV